MALLIIDDPMLALIVRFANCCESVDVSQEEFLRQQLEEIHAYIAGCPKAREQERVLEWIESNAERYRRNWQEKVVADQASANRCPDCPLVEREQGVYCEIHGRWLKILSQYTAGETSSHQYVEDSLILLRQHKERLRVKVVDDIAI